MDSGGVPPASGSPFSHEGRVGDQGRRRRVHDARQLSAAVAPPVVVLLALLLATGSAGALTTGPWLLAVWTAVATAAALHRPFGTEQPSLGLGAVAMAPLLGAGDAVSAALVAGLAVLLADLAHRAAIPATVAGSKVAERPLAPTFERATVSVLAVLVTAAPVARLSADFEAIVGFIAAPLLFALTVLLASAGLDLLRRPGRPRVPPLPPLGLDVVGWWIGSGLVLTVAADLGPAAPVRGVGALWLWLLVAVLAAEAARSGFLRTRAEVRLTSYERLHQAHERILAE
ncbi:MAG: hypothetical protein AAGF23_21505, partial [Acidobacteriota bacterium]